MLIPPESSQSIPFDPVPTFQVGHHYQLSPLVTSKEAQEGGLGTSLFRILSEVAPQVGHNPCQRPHLGPIRSLICLVYAIIILDHLFQRGGYDVSNGQLYFA